MARSRLEEPNEKVGNYFTAPKALEFISSGAAILDCVIGGGWPLARIANIVGDESTGKTLLAIEAAANFARQYPTGRVFYREAESAFDEDYAKQLGMPVQRVEFIDPEKFLTVEDFYDDLTACVKLCRKEEIPGLYIVDSLDALSDRAEQKQKFDEGGYGTAKAKAMSKLLRMCRLLIAEARVCLVIISQTRDKINSMYGGKTRAGGKALDFYCSQIIWLSHVSDVIRESGKIKRVVGVRIQAKCDKNKISLPYRRCNFNILFGQGIDSMATSLDWLEQAGRLEEVIDTNRVTFRTRLRKMSDDEYWAESRRIDAETVRIWNEVEEQFMERERPRLKYREA